MAIEYKWHDHPLQLRPIPSDASAICFVCNQSVSGYNFRCPTPACKFFLHIPCLKTPLESLHPLHHHHPPLSLSFSLSPPSPSSICPDCKTPSSGFTYTCPSCPFSLHLHCANKIRTFNFEIHKHPLTFSPSPPSGYESFRCYVCGETGLGFSLSCKQGCQFVAHVECSVLPVTVKREGDDYPFALVTARSVDDDEPEELYCDVCEKTVNLHGCIYYCKERSYISHLGCLISAKKTHFKSAYKDFDPKSVKALDAPKIESSHESTSYGQSHHQSSTRNDSPVDELTELRIKFSEIQIGEKGQSGIKSIPSDLQHFSHPHELILTDVFKRETMICYACWGRFKGNAYLCRECDCDFGLHKWCADLPKEIQYPLHPNTLSLIIQELPNINLLVMLVIYLAMASSTAAILAISTSITFVLQSHPFSGMKSTSTLSICGKRRLIVLLVTRVAKIVPPWFSSVNRAVSTSISIVHCCLTKLGTNVTLILLSSPVCLLRKTMIRRSSSVMLVRKRGIQSIGCTIVGIVNIVLI